MSRLIAVAVTGCLSLAGATLVDARQAGAPPSPPTPQATPKVNVDPKMDVHPKIARPPNAPLNPKPGDGKMVKPMRPAPSDPQQPGFRPL